MHKVLFNDSIVLYNAKTVALSSNAVILYTFPNASPFKIIFNSSFDPMGAIITKWAVKKKAIDEDKRLE
jgi:hypothetical protein